MVLPSHVISVWENVRSIKVPWGRLRLDWNQGCGLPFHENGGALIMQRVPMRLNGNESGFVIK